MKYANIKFCDSANGDGVRTTLFVSGCRNHCKGCFQPETWDFNYGKIYTKETQKEIIESLKPDFISGLTILGGDPFEEENQKDVMTLLKEVKIIYPEKITWCYTGYIYDRDLIVGGKKYTEYTDRLIRSIDVLVDGPFIEEKKSIKLVFRGSSNQRIISIPETIKQGKVVTLEYNW